LTREGIGFRLSLAVQKAARSCPSLKKRWITPHTFRHTAVMQTAIDFPLEVGMSVGLQFHFSRGEEACFSHDGLNIARCFGQ